MRSVWVAELNQRHGFVETSNCVTPSKFGGMNVSDAISLKGLQSENSCPKQLLAEPLLKTAMQKGDLQKPRCASSQEVEWCADTVTTGPGFCDGVSVQVTVHSGTWRRCNLPLCGRRPWNLSFPPRKGAAGFDFVGMRTPKCAR